MERADVDVATTRTLGDEKGLVEDEGLKHGVFFKLHSREFGPLRQFMPNTVLINAQSAHCQGCRRRLKPEQAIPNMVIST